MANGSLTSVGDKKLVDTFTGVSVYSIPSLWVALVKATSNATTAGTEIVTGEYTGYARLALTGATWGGANTSGVSTYGAALDFGNNASGSGATIVGIELWDASSSGNRIWYAPFSGGNIVLPASGGDIQFASNAISATVPPVTSNSGFSQTYCQRLCDHFTGKTSFVAPTAMWAFLSTAQSSTTAIGTESTYTNYARVQIVTPSTFFNAGTSASPSVVTNASQLSWATVGATAGSNVIAWGIADTISGSNLVYADTFTGSYTPVTGQTPAILVSTNMIKVS